MSNYNTIREKFKSLFLNELLVDDGWSAFIDLLLRNIDVTFLQFCRTNGFPYEVHFSDYVKRQEGTPPTFSSEVFDVEYLNGVVTLTYPKSATSPRLDFGDVTVALNTEGLIRLSVKDGEAWQELYFYDASSDHTVGQPVIELTPDTSFQIEYEDLLEDGTVFDLYTTLLYLPEQINPASIQYYKNYNLMLVNEDTSATSPQALFGAVAQLLQGLRFYMVFNTADGGGDRQKAFPRYVTLYDVVKTPAVNDVPAHISAITAARVPLDALRDKFGYGAQQAQILGYDKNVLVVLDNNKDGTLIALQANPPQTADADIMVLPLSIEFLQRATSGVVGVEVSGAYEGAWNVEGASDVQARMMVAQRAAQRSAIPESTAQVLVTTNPPQGFTPILSEVTQPTPDHKYLVAQLGDGYALLCSSESILYETLYGITKNYDMLSLDKGRLLSVNLYIEELRSNVQQIYGDRFEALLKALEDLLAKFVPIGVGFSVNFVYPMIESKLSISDNYLGVSDAIYINGKSGTTTISLPNRKSAYQFNIDTNPATLGWSIQDSVDEN